MDIEKTNKKLEKFENMAVKDSAKKAGRFIDKEKAENRKFSEKQEIAFLQEAYEKIQQAMRGIEKESEEVYSEKLIEVKHMLFSKRMEIINAVFYGTEKKLEAYRKSEGYPDTLKAFIKTGVGEVGSGRITIITDKQDMKKAAVIANQLNVEFEIKQSENPINGGCIIINTDTGISADYSFKSRLKSQREDFLRYSGMKIDI